MQAKARAITLVYFFTRNKYMNSAGALAELKNFQSTRKGASSYYDQAQNELGVGNVKARADDLRGIIRNTETALKGVNASVGGRTRGQLVTEAQRSRLENIERQPLMEGVASQQGALSDEMQSYRDLLGQAGTKSGLLYQTDTDKANALQQTYQNVMAQETAAREEAARKEAERQWWADFNARQSQFDRQLAEARRSAAANEANMARINSGTSDSNQGYADLSNLIKGLSKTASSSKTKAKSGGWIDLNPSSSKKGFSGISSRDMGNWFADRATDLGLFGLKR